MSANRHRPRVHLSASHGWLNDPNGPIQHRGTYHVFAQHNPDEPVHRAVHWAHWTSTDLATWIEQPIALTPVPGGADADGCWSGSAIDLDGEIVLVYSGYLEGDAYQSVCIARPRSDGTWAADAEPVLLRPPAELGAALMRDPFLWRVGDEVRMMLGSGTVDGTPMAIVFSSSDLREWAYTETVLSGAHPVFDGVATGQGWECPQLLRRGDRGLLVMSDWSPPGQLDGVSWASGRLDGDALEPTAVGRFDFGPDYYAADLFVDERGEAISWAWSWEACDPALVEARGWAGLLTLPRSVRLSDDGTPEVAPAAPFDRLGMQGRFALDIELAAGQDHWLDGGSDSLSVDARLAPGPEGTAWLRVLGSPDRTEFAEIGFDRVRGEVYLDREGAGSGTGGRYAIPVGDHPDGIDVVVVVDVSILEVFAAGKSLTARVYPTASTSTGIAVGAERAAGRVRVAGARLDGAVEARRDEKLPRLDSNQ